MPWASKMLHLQIERLMDIRIICVASESNTLIPNVSLIIITYYYRFPQTLYPTVIYLNHLKFFYERYHETTFWILSVNEQLSCIKNKLFSIWNAVLRKACFRSNELHWQAL